MPCWAVHHVRNLRNARYEHITPGRMSDVLVRPEQTDVGKVGTGLLVSGDAVQESRSQHGSIAAAVDRGSSTGAGYVFGALRLTWRWESDQRLTHAHIFNLSEVAAVGISRRAYLHVGMQDQPWRAGSQRRRSVAAFDVKIAEVGMFEDGWISDWFTGLIEKFT